MHLDRKERRRIGSWLAAELPKFCTLRQAAQAIGVSKKMILHIEQDALWKIYRRMQTPSAPFRYSASIS